MTSPLTVKRNDYATRPKRSDIYTPRSVAQFLFDILCQAGPVDAHRLVRPWNNPNGLHYDCPRVFLTVLDPAIGSGNLTDPWYKTRKIMGCDIVDRRPQCHQFILGRFEDQEHITPTPSLVLCNPPFNGADGKQLYPEVFLRHAFKLFGETMPVVLFAPMGMRLNQRKKSTRWRWLRDSKAELTSIVSLPLDIFSGVEFHAEILMFNVKGVRPHYFLPEEAV